MGCYLQDVNSDVNIRLKDALKHADWKFVLPEDDMMENLTLNVTTQVTMPYNKASKTSVMETPVEDYDLKEVQSVLLLGDRYVVASIFFSIMCSGLLGNGVVIIAVILSKNLRSVTYAFVVALSFADLLVMMNIPVSIVSMLSTDGWPLPEWICASSAFTFITCIGFSICTMAAIAVNRLVLFTVSRETYDYIFSPVRTALILLSIAMINIAVASPPMWFNFGQLGYDKQYSSCTWDKTHPHSQTYEIFVTLIQYPIPLFVCVSCYTKLYFVIRKQTKRMLSKSDSSGSTDSANLRKTLSRRQMEVTRSMFYILCTFIVCTMPFAVVMVVNSPGRFGPYSGCILLLNGAINPLIYAVKLPTLKREMLCLLKCKF